MASTSTLTSPATMIFDEVKDRTYAKVVLPKTIKPVLTGLGSLLRATALPFSPETTTAPELPPGLTPMKLSFTDNGSPNGRYRAVGPYVTRVDNVPNFTSNVVSHSDTTNYTNGSEAQSRRTTSTSPALSTATTVHSSEVSATPISWADECTLEDVIGREMTNELINRFDPTFARVPRGLLKTGPITNPRNRYLLHEVTERVWGGRLLHETGRKDSCMYIWAPGTKVPRWLEQVHMNHKRNDRKKTPAEKLTSDKVGAKPVHVKPERPVNGVWTTFSQDENVRYGKVATMSATEYVEAERKRAEELGEKKSEGAERNFVFKEKFKQTRSQTTDSNLNTQLTHQVADGTANESKKVVLPPHLRARGVSPPHLRAKSADLEKKADVKDADINANASDGEKGAWVAAKLPNPYCSG